MELLIAGNRAKSSKSGKSEAQRNEELAALIWREREEPEETPLFLYEPGLRNLSSAELDAESDLHADANEFPPARTEVAARILVHVGGRNRRDVAVAERIRRRHPDAALVLVRSADHGPDLYPRPRLDALVRSTFSPRS